MKFFDEKERKVILIRYYNVIFYLIYEESVEEFKIGQLIKRINAGERMTMRILTYWCVIQNITYYTRFIYRRDFEFKANLWNFYSYCRYRIENILMK